MIPLSVLLLALVGSVVLAVVSAMRSSAALRQRSIPLMHLGVEVKVAALAKALGVDRIPVRVLDDPTINGCAAPDGQVYITRGLIERYDGGSISGEEIASVVAHEVGHLALGHLRRRQIAFVGQSVAGQLVLSQLARLLPGVGPLVFWFLTQVLFQALSRKDEFEADAYASALMIKAGFGAGPQKALFQKLAAMSAGQRGKPAWLMSHPPAGERIRAIEANEARWAG